MIISREVNAKGEYKFTINGREVNKKIEEAFDKFNNLKFETALAQEIFLKLCKKNKLY